MSDHAAPQHRVVCAWCPTVLVEGDVGAPISHGICDPCIARVEAPAPAAERKTMEDPGNPGTWVIIWDGQLCSPTFNSKGAADICLGMYQSGARKPELAREFARHE